MIENMFKNIILKFVINYLTSIPSKLYKEMILNDTDPKDIFLTLIENAPDYLFELDEEALYEAMEYVRGLTYRKMIEEILTHAPGWFNEMKDFIIPDGSNNDIALKTKKWFEKYILKRLKQWSETGTVPDLEKEVEAILRKRGIYIGE